MGWARIGPRAVDGLYFTGYGRSGIKKCWNVPTLQQQPLIKATPVLLIFISVELAAKTRG